MLIDSVSYRLDEVSHKHTSTKAFKVKLKRILITLSSYIVSCNSSIRKAIIFLRF